PARRPTSATGHVAGFETDSAAANPAADAGPARATAGRETHSLRWVLGWVQGWVRGRSQCPQISDHPAANKANDGERQTDLPGERGGTAHTDRRPSEQRPDVAS